MLSIISTELRKYNDLPTGNNIVYFTSIPPSHADVGYDFILHVDSNDGECVKRIVYEVCGNIVDSYTVDLWPNTAPTRDKDVLIYKLDFWFSNESTAYMLYAHPFGSRFIYIYTTSPCKITLQYTGITYFNKYLDTFRSAMKNTITHNITTHEEIKDNVVFKLIRCKSYIIHGDFTHVESIVTTDAIYYIDKSIKSFAAEVNDYPIYDIKINTNSSDYFTIVYYKHNICNSYEWRVTVRFSN